MSWTGSMGCVNTGKVGENVAWLQAMLAVFPTLGPVKDRCSKATSVGKEDRQQWQSVR